MYFKRIEKILILFLLSVIFIGFTVGALADGASSCEANGTCTLKDAFKTGDGSNSDPLDSAASGANYDTAKDKTSPDFIIASVIQSVLSFLGVVFIVLMVYGGYLWMTAAGNDEQVEKAKDLITAAVVGVVIILAAYAISYFVISKMTAISLKT